MTIDKTRDHDAYAVPSGIFGLARAQNAGCTYSRMERAVARVNTYCLI
jgi:hypothetical protein